MQQLRPGLWDTVNERHPGSMSDEADFVPLAPLRKPRSECRLAFVSTVGVQPKGSVPFDSVHPAGDYTFRRVPAAAPVEDLEIRQLKYPTAGAQRDRNVIFLIERLQELADEGVIGGLTEHCFSSIGYNTDPERLEWTLVAELAAAVSEEGADIVLAAPA